MRLYTAKELSEIVGVTEGQILRDKEAGYLAPGLKTKIDDDRELILNNYNCKKYIRMKGDITKCSKWKGTYGKTSYYHNYKIGVIKYRGVFVGVAVAPDGNIRTFVSMIRNKAKEYVINFAKSDTSFISKERYGEIGLAVMVALSYEDINNILAKLPPTKKYYRLINKLVDSKRKSIIKKEKSCRNL